MKRPDLDAMRTSLSASSLVARRRARRDLPQLFTTAGLVAVTTLLSVLAPGLMLDTLDKGAQDAVLRAGSDADVLVQVTVGAPQPGSRYATASGAIDLADGMMPLLPPALSSVITGSTLSVRSADVDVRAVDGIPTSGRTDLVTQLAMLTPTNTAAFTLLEGELPSVRTAESRDPIEVVISKEAADLSGLSIGSTFDLGIVELIDPTLPVDPDDEPDPITLFTVVGIAEAPSAVDDALWEDTPEVWAPRVREATPTARSQIRFTALAAPSGITAAELFLDYPLIGTVRLNVEPESFTSALAAATVTEARELTANGQVLAGETLADIGVQSGLTSALDRYPSESRAALAQMSLMMAGVLGIASVALVLLSRLLVAQRTAAIALERARGASVLSIGVRALMESLVVTAAGATVGIVAALLLLPGGLRDTLPIAMVVLVAIFAGPMQAMALSRGMWTGRRDPANRRDRQLLARKRSAQRVVIEAAVIALAAASLVAIRTRGLLQSRSEGIDPLLVAAPLLLAVAVTIIVIRIYPYPVRAVGALAQRTRGVLGLLGSVRARSAVAALPLLALALGASLTVTGAMLLDTVKNGQDEAAWQRVGADARIDAELQPSEVEALEAAPGVDVVSAFRSRGGVSLDIGTSTATVTILSVDSAFPDVMTALPDQPSAESLRELSTTFDEPDVLPLIVDEATAERLFDEDIAMYYGPAYVKLRVIGTSAVAPNGYLDGPFAYVDSDLLSALLPEPQAANRYLVMGDGAAEAAAALSVEAGAVSSFDQWLQDRRSLALVSGVDRAMVFAVSAVALLSIVSLVATVIGGARARGRALSMLRTLGMQPKLGWWLALAELGPLIGAAILGGAAAGVIVIVSLTPSIGLDVLAGGVTMPQTSISPMVFIALAGAGVLLLLLGALADVLVHRRDKLSEVLRVGETV